MSSVIAIIVRGRRERKAKKTWEQNAKFSSHIVVLQCLSYILELLPDVLGKALLYNFQLISSWPFLMKQVKWLLSLYTQSLHTLERLLSSPLHTRWFFPTNGCVPNVLGLFTWIEVGGRTSTFSCWLGERWKDIVYRKRDNKVYFLLTQTKEN